MKKAKPISLLLLILSAVTFVNMAFMYFIPVLLPISNFTALRFEAVAFIEKKYYLVLFGILINAVILASSLAVKKGKLLLPIISSLIYAVDFAFVAYLFISEIIKAQYIAWMYLPHIILDILVLISLIYYEENARGVRL